MTKKSVDTREIVFDGLMAILEKEQYSHIIVGQILNKYSYLEKQERAFITRLISGVLENVFLLDDIIDAHSKTKTVKMKPVIRMILRMAVYQIYFMDGVKNFAAINEAVNLAKKRGFKTLSGFVNGVLRSAERGFADYKLPDSLSLRYSVPEWLVNVWTDAYGTEKTEGIIRGFSKENGVAVRMNLSKGKSREEILKSLREENVIYTEVKQLSAAIILTGFDSLADITMFRDGYIIVQDISSMLVAHAAAPKAGSNVLDVCAAPGGKSLHIADMLNGSGHVEARDKTEYKADLIRDNLIRAGFDNVSVQVWDATEPDENLIEKEDIVIADLPCSGLGVLGKKPDIRYRVKEEDLESLAALQREILKVVWQYVKIGGCLIYSTCTINPEENENNVKWFTSQFPFELEAFDADMPCISDEEKKNGMVQIFPKENTDGFFIARLKRIG